MFLLVVYRKYCALKRCIAILYEECLNLLLLGWLLIKNWRPLTLTMVTRSENDTVGAILGELTSLATLKIYIRRSSSNIHLEIKNKVLRWLLGQSQNLISNTCFPLDEV